jgi:hypothetical protein
MSAPPGFNPAQSLLPDVAAPITPAMGGGGMIGGATTDFLEKLLPKIKTHILTIRYMNKGGQPTNYSINREGIMDPNGGRDDLRFALKHFNA